VTIQDIDTPAVIIDLDVVERNIKRFQSYCDTHHIHNRPHVKTHKIPELAALQLSHGAVGITCQKVGEAEVMAGTGVSDILITYSLCGRGKLTRAMALARRIKLSVTCDSAPIAEGLSAVAASAGVVMDVLVECDTGLGRCGVQQPQDAALLGTLIARLPGLQFKGLMTYPLPGRVAETSAFLAEAKRRCVYAGLDVVVVSSGGTPSMWQAHAIEGLTEYRAGVYVYNDRGSLRSGAARPEDCAMRVATTVISRPSAERAIIDAGSKALSSDQYGLDGYGAVLEYPEARVSALHEEHGFVDVSGCATRPEISERVHIIPNHACAVTNLHDSVVGVRGEKIEVQWPVAARGKLA
jgi:D-serine deaminase-like pyridoxal phosphate-dependent protein